MPKACNNCGADCKKTKGSYQELCPECLNQAAEQIRQKNTPHVARCEQETCSICHSKLTEMQEGIQPLYVHVLLLDKTTPNTTLTDYQ